MAVIPQDLYVGKIDTTDPTGYPQGKAQNVTTPGDNTGTPWEQQVTNDLFGFEQAMLNAGEVVPSGTADKVDASDYLDALTKMFGVNIASFGQQAVQYISDQSSGGNTKTPENTIASVEFAGRGGFHSSFCNVQLSGDNVWVLMKDHALLRTTGEIGNVEDYTVAELQTFDTGSEENGSPIFDGYFTGYTVPTLDEYLRVCRKFGMPPMIEIENYVSYSDSAIQQLIDQCRTIFTDNQFTIVSDNQPILTTLRTLDKFVKLQYNVGTYSDAAVDFCVTVRDCWLTASYNSLPANLDYATARRILINADGVFDPDNALIVVNKGVRQVTGDYINLP